MNLLRYLLPAAMVGLALTSRLDGQTAWTRHTIDASSRGADGVRAADADGDGDLDIATGWEASGVTRLYLNPGAAAAHRPWPIVHCGDARKVEDAVIVDVDGDGAMDVVSATEYRSEKVLVHFAPRDPASYADSTAWTTRAFPESVVPASYWMYSLPMDVNGDGRVDLVVGSKQKAGQVGWIEAPAGDRRDLGRWRYHRITEAGWIMSIRAWDVDGDGDRDILISDRKKYRPGQGIRWLANPGPAAAAKGPWASHVIGMRHEPAFIDIGDLDGDGDIDIAGISVHRKLAWFSRPDDPRQPWIQHAIDWPDGVGTIGKSVRIVDVDGDGRMDLACTFSGAEGKSGLSWLSYRNAPTDASWIRHEVAGPEGIKFDRIEPIDVDGDGDVDLLTTEERGATTAGQDALGVVWYENPTVGP